MRKGVSITTVTSHFKGEGGRLKLTGHKWIWRSSDREGMSMTEYFLITSIRLAYY